ncbi:MAG: glycogen/starch synthase [Bacteroidaceae bacterium]|nr:glycogen/starch synthase [Bacteroidaceae bacterium]
MGSAKRKANYIFSVSWEVCNKIGGIYTVLSTQAKTLKEQSGATLIYVGPDIWEGKNNPLFIEDKSLYAIWKDYARDTDGIPVRTGYWNIPGRPIVILVDFMANYSLKNQIYGSAWELFGVDSMHAYGDYDEASMFSYTAAMAVKSFYNFNIGSNDTVIYHAHEWMTGLGALFLKYYIPQISTVFTTHATSVGRSICGNGKALYEFFDGYNGDQMARELNMEAKHSVEKRTAHLVDCFTTVSDITARECTQLLERKPDVVTVNGFEDGFLPSPDRFGEERRNARGCILSVINKLFGTEWGDETVIVATGGRYEYRNKGIDLFLESMRKLRDNGRTGNSHILALINVPAWVMEPRRDLQDRVMSHDSGTSSLPMPLTTHWLHNMGEDRVICALQSMGFRNAPEDNIKVLFVPCYLDGQDGIFNKSYYELLIGQDMAIFPSYYEPWGYTPLESAAFRVPTVTSDLAGFGLWVNTVLKRNAELEDGVKVVHRNDSNWNEAATDISLQIEKWVAMSHDEREVIRQKAGKLAQKALWKHFIKYYLDAYDFAVNKNEHFLRNEI